MKNSFIKSVTNRNTGKGKNIQNLASNRLNLLKAGVLIHFHDWNTS